MQVSISCLSNILVEAGFEAEMDSRSRNTRPRLKVNWRPGNIGPKVEYLVVCFLLQTENIVMVK